MTDVILAFVLGTSLAGLLGYFAYMKISGRLRDAEDRGILDDLEFATKEQLLKEFRGRPNNTYILLTPINTKEAQGLKIELNNVTSFDGLTMLHLATTIIYREMKSRSMAVPNLGPIVSEIEEDDDEDDGEQLGPDQETDGEKD